MKRKLSGGALSRESMGGVDTDTSALQSQCLDEDPSITRATKKKELVDTVLKLREAHFCVEDTTLTQGIMHRYSRETFHRASYIGALRIEDVRTFTCMGSLQRAPAFL